METKTTTTSTSRGGSIFCSRGVGFSFLGLGLGRFPLPAFRLPVGAVRLPGAFGRTAAVAVAVGDGSEWSGRLRGGGGGGGLGGGVQLVVLQAAELAGGGPGPQRPLLVSLAEGVGAELAERLRVLPTHVAVVPRAVPPAW